MSRVKGRFVGLLIIDIDVPYDSKKDWPIAKAKENFRTEMPSAVEEEVLGWIGGNSTVELKEQYLDMYEVRDEADSLRI